jgi:hypothetical protein
LGPGKIANLGVPHSGKTLPLPAGQLNRFINPGAVGGIDSLKRELRDHGIETVIAERDDRETRKVNEWGG